MNNYFPTPAVPVPMNPKELKPFGYGKRYLVTQNGLYVEVQTKVFAAQFPLCHVCVEDALPFGEVQPVVRAPRSYIPRELFDEAIAKARACLPKEWAGLILFEEGEYRLHEPEIIESSGHRVSYRLDYDPESVVVDIHSHQYMRAFFSNEDDLDDRKRGGAYLAIVLGNLDEDVPTVAARVVAYGHFSPLRAWPFGGFPSSVRFVDNQENDVS